MTREYKTKKKLSLIAILAHMYGVQVNELIIRVNKKVLNAIVS